ncbi:MAG TPA: DUF1761 domain-containing protein [Chitinophagaceae bacterium]|nr:DUF1761 domain-containing protein [Chitinophagaceae bacterium]
MLQNFLDQVNLWAVLVAALAYFLLGSLWFSVLFGSVWSKEVDRMGILIKDPPKGTIAAKMIQTFVGNLLAAFSMAYIVFISGSYTWMAGLKLGLLCGIGFAAVAMIIAYTWESRSMRLQMIDTGYAVIGIALCGIILAAWR